MIDLHTHSTYSDGTFTPQQLLDYAAAQGITTLALTDHDTIDGVKECKEYALIKSIRAISGVELSVNWSNKVIHVIALGIDIENPALTDLLYKQQQMRQERAICIGDLLEKNVGLKNGYEKALKLATGGLVARPHFARILVEEKFCKDMKTAFKRYLTRGKSAYVRTQWVQMGQGIDILKQSGGMPVLAHPLKYKLTRTKLHELISDFKTMGGMALEVISGLSSADETAHLSALSCQYGMLASVGSDFHGETLTPHSMKYLKSLPKSCSALMDSPFMEKK